MVKEDSMKELERLWEGQKQFSLKYLFQKPKYKRYLFASFFVSIIYFSLVQMYQDYYSHYSFSSYFVVEYLLGSVPLACITLVYVACALCYSLLFQENIWETILWRTKFLLPTTERTKFIAFMLTVLVTTYTAIIVLEGNAFWGNIELYVPGVFYWVATMHLYLKNQN